MSTSRSDDNAFITDDPLDLIPESRREHVRLRLEKLAALVPTEPGEYVDETGDRWTLTADGRWYDHEGATRPPAWNALLGGFGLQPA